MPPNETQMFKTHHSPPAVCVRPNAVPCAGPSFSPRPGWCLPAAGPAPPPHNARPPPEPRTPRPPPPATPAGGGAPPAEAPVRSPAPTSTLSLSSALPSPIHASPTPDPPALPPPLAPELRPSQPVPPPPLGEETVAAASGPPTAEDPEVEQRRCLAHWVPRPVAEVCWAGGPNINGRHPGPPGGRFPNPIFPSGERLVSSWNSFPECRRGIPLSGFSCHPVDTIPPQQQRFLRFCSAMRPQ